MVLFSHSLCQDDLGFCYGSAPRTDIGELIARMVKNQENAQMTQPTVDYQGMEERPAWVGLLSSWLQNAFIYKQLEKYMLLNLYLVSKNNTNKMFLWMLFDECVKSAFQHSDWY